MTTQSNTPVTANDEINDEQLAGISGGAPTRYEAPSYSTLSANQNTAYMAPSVRYPTTSTTTMSPPLLPTQGLPLRR